MLALQRSAGNAAVAACCASRTRHVRELGAAAPIPRRPSPRAVDPAAPGLRGRCARQVEVGTHRERASASVAQAEAPRPQAAAVAAGGDEARRRRRQAQSAAMEARQPGGSTRRASSRRSRRRSPRRRRRTSRRPTSSASSGKADAVEAEVAGRVARARTPRRGRSPTRRRSRPTRPRRRIKPVTPLPADRPGRAPGSTPAAGCRRRAPAEQTDLSDGNRADRRADGRGGRHRGAAGNEQRAGVHRRARRQEGGRAHAADRAGRGARAEAATSPAREQGAAGDAQGRAGRPCAGTKAAALTKAARRQQTGEVAGRGGRAPQVNADLTGDLRRAPRPRSRRSWRHRHQVDDGVRRGRRPSARRLHQQSTRPRWRSTRTRATAGSAAARVGRRHALLGLPQEANQIFERAKARSTRPR